MLRMFRGISVSQLVAGALASVTALFLSTRIGLAGSLIGAAVSFVVSSTCAQVFNNVLKDSQEQLFNLYGNSGSDAQDAEGERSTQEGRRGEGRRVVSGEADAELTMVSRLGTTASAAPKPGVDVPLPPKPGMRSAASRSGSAGARMPARPVPLPGMDAQLKRKAKRRRVIAVVLSVVTALATVGITAAVVLALTNGQGTDTVVRDVVTPQVGQNQTTTGGTTQNLLPNGKDPATQHGSGSTSDSTGSTSDSTTGDSTGSSTGDADSGTGSTGSGSTSDSGSAGSGSSSGSTGSSSGSTTGGADSGTGSTGSGSTSDSGSTGSGSSSGSDGSSSGSTTGGADSESSSGSTAGGTGSNSALAQ